MTIRRFLFWAHLACGVLAGLVILALSATGALLTYERQMVAWADTAGLAAITESSERASLDVILSAARRHAPETAATAVTLSSDPQAPLAVSLGRERVLYFNPYSGMLLGEGAQPMRHFLGVAKGVHRWFNVGEDGRAAARAITGAANLLFAFLLLSGIYLWLPRVYRWSQFRLRMVLQRHNPSSRARDFNWHHVLGFWSFLPLLLIVVSGIVFSYPWANNLLFRMLGEEPPVRGEFRKPERVGQNSASVAGGRLDELLQRARSESGEWQTLTFNLPAAQEQTASVIVDRGDGGQPQLQSTLLLDIDSGEVRSHEQFTDLSPGRRARSILRRLHTGEVFGIAGQTVAGVVSLAAALLVWTGLALAYRRLLRPLFVRSRA